MEAIPPAVRSVLDLFTTDLSEVRFPDVDAKVLAGLEADVHAAAEAVASAQVALDHARGALQQRKDLLLQHAQRALAYARVFAETNDGLSARLDAITLTRPPRRGRGEAAEGPAAAADPSAPPRRRGRPPKARSETLALEVIEPAAE
jgi:hypothetical protein